MRRWCVPEQYDRLIGGSRLIYSRLWVPFPSRAKRFWLPHIGIPPCSDRLAGIQTPTVHHGIYLVGGRVA